MDEVSKNEDCHSCVHYANFAYYCLVQKKWKFPEDWTCCSEYKEGNWKERSYDETCQCT